MFNDTMLLEPVTFEIVIENIKPKQIVVHVEGEKNTLHSACICLLAYSRQVVEGGYAENMVRCRV